MSALDATAASFLPSLLEAIDFQGRLLGSVCSVQETPASVDL